ncbi:MAG: SDR family NAD(P)-dependent oxidoreductase [Bacteriovoracia bacterium]
MKTVFITGASSGIGAAVAKEYAKLGANLVLCARRTDRLNKVLEDCLKENPNVKAILVSCDVTKPDDLQRAAKKAIEAFGGIDIVLANAGFGVAGSVAKLTIDDYKRQFDTNVYGVINTVQGTLEPLKKSKGCIGIVGSIYSYISEGFKSPYCMSKFAVRALATSLRQEQRKNGIHVCLIAPGLIESEIRQVDNQGIYNPEQKDYAPEFLRMPTNKAARQIVRALEKRKSEQIITNHGKIAVFLERHFPWFLDWLVSRYLIKMTKRPTAK